MMNTMTIAMMVTLMIMVMIMMMMMMIWMMMMRRMGEGFRNNLGGAARPSPLIASSW